MRCGDQPLHVHTVLEVKMSVLPLVVFSHLRWDFVYQRPQHLLSRFARERAVVVIEEPVYDLDVAPHWERLSPHPQVSIFRPHTPCPAGGFAETQLPYLQKLVAPLVQEEHLRQCLLWLYTPMALPLIDFFEPEVLIFDCMDDLSAFDFAPPQLGEREQQLLKRADVVFTGGPSLYRAKQDQHPHVHLFPSSVDAAHFRQALHGLVEPPDQALLPHPRLGFFGVLDERMDLPLLTHLAVSHPAWHIIMVGPVVKIDPTTLPQAPNVHYLGQRSYEALPAYLAGWDVCLLPFARNAATRFISPTKTLEYMAAERLIVSTPIPDVQESYGDIVSVGHTPEAFVEACERALASSHEERMRQREHMRAVLQKTSWDATAAAMQQIIDEAGARKRCAASALSPGGEVLAVPV
jgi:UDP-galactopyranose mutase